MRSALAGPGRLATVSLVLLSALSTGLSAQRRDSKEWQLSCSRYRGDDDTERFCQVIEKTLPLPSGALNVDGRVNGGITVIGENRRDVLVRVIVQAHARSAARAEALVEGVTIETANGRIAAYGPETSRNREGWSASFEVHVPFEADLQLQARNGGIAVAGVTGTLRMETQNGGIHLDAVNGDVVAETSNGGLRVDLDGERWEGKGLDASTSNGGIQLNLPRNYSARLETGTVNGGLDIDFPVMVQGRIGRRITTDLGRGGATIRVVTQNGGVNIRKIQ